MVSFGEVEDNGATEEVQAQVKQMLASCEGDVSKLLGAVFTSLNSDPSTGFQGTAAADKLLVTLKGDLR